MPFLIALLVLAIELSPVHFLYTGPFLTATPALAAVTMGPRGTLSAVACAVIVSVITATHNQAWGTMQVYSNLLALLLVSVAGVLTSKAVRARRLGELNQIRRIAVAAQEAVLRPVPSQLGAVRPAGMYLAAEAGAQIGGDLYEVAQTPFGIRMIVGDVRGKGLPAARAAASLLGAFRESVHYEESLEDVVKHCEAALRREYALREAIAAAGEEDAPERFVTTLVAQIPDAPLVQLINRGHPPPLKLHHGKVEALDAASPQPPLGLDDFITGPPPKAESHPFTPGDRLLLYTDGVSEGRNRDNVFFPVAEAMEAVRAVAPSQFLEELHQALVRHTGNRLADDAAMLLVDRMDEVPPEAAQ
ncbi:PP2C family protein-serine/threonine phosphatase [Streptomyces sp. NPDC051776]|uniref:PP2C family protein-serine/threonine phosphatase n=1 Tax=Streptomyces sp. NPDC051776 TaxID=3155414 RepID=UPI0034349831